MRSVPIPMQSIMMITLLIGMSACTTVQDPQLKSTDESLIDQQQLDADAQVASEEEADKPSNDPNEVICKMTRVTGSKFKKRACQTRAEWEQLARQGREFTDNLDRKNRGMIRN